MLKKLFKFAFTGGLGTITNLLLFFIFADKIGINPTVVSVCCFLIAGTQNYIINHLWTFKIENENRPLSIKLWAKFLCASLLRLVVNLAVLNILLHLYDWPLKVIPQGAGILVAMFFNFAASNFFVFKKKE